MGSLLPGWNDSDAVLRARTQSLEGAPEWLKELRASGESPTLAARRSKGDPFSAHKPAHGDHGHIATSPRASDSLAHETTPTKAELQAALTKCTSGLRRPNLSRASDSSYFMTRSTAAADGAAAKSFEHDHTAKVAWWKHMSSSTLNEARTDVPADYRTGSYQPQNDTAHIHQRQHVDGDAKPRTSIDSESTSCE